MHVCIVLYWLDSLHTNFIEGRETESWTNMRKSTYIIKITLIYGPWLLPQSCNNFWFVGLGGFVCFFPFYEA